MADVSEVESGASMTNTLEKFKKYEQTFVYADDNGKTVEVKVPVVPSSALPEDA